MTKFQGLYNFLAETSYCSSHQETHICLYPQWAGDVTLLKSGALNLTDNGWVFKTRYNTSFIVPSELETLAEEYSLLPDAPASCPIERTIVPIEMPIWKPDSKLAVLKHGYHSDQLLSPGKIGSIEDFTEDPKAEYFYLFREGLFVFQDEQLGLVRLDETYCCTDTLVGEKSILNRLDAGLNLFGLRAPGKYEICRVEDPTNYKPGRGYHDYNVAIAFKAISAPSQWGGKRMCYAEGMILLHVTNSGSVEDWTNRLDAMLRPVAIVTSGTDDGSTIFVGNQVSDSLATIIQSEISDRVVRGETPLPDQRGCEPNLTDDQIMFWFDEEGKIDSSDKILQKVKEEYSNFFGL